MALFVDWSLDFYGSSSLNMILIACSGIARYMEFIPTARVPILQYMSNHFGISCDVSINNYPGQIKSIILYWICTMDERFGDMVLLVSSMYPSDVFFLFAATQLWQAQGWWLGIIPCRSRNGQKLKILMTQKMEPWTPILCACLLSFISRSYFLHKMLSLLIMYNSLKSIGYNLPLTLFALHLPDMWACNFTTSEGDFWWESCRR